MSKILENRPLFKECVDALGITLLPDVESDLLHELFKFMFPLTDWGKVDWDKVTKKTNIGCDPRDIIPALEQLLDNKFFNRAVYIDTSTGGLPVIRTNLDDIINNFDDVTCIAFEKFIFNLDLGYIIEVLPSNDMTVGLIEKARIILCINLKKFLQALSDETFHNEYNNRWILKLLNPFVQPKYWNIGEPHYVKSAAEIIPFIELSLKHSIKEKVLLMWEDSQFPIIETDLDKIISLWDILIEMGISFQVAALNSTYRIDVNAEDGIKIIINYGLRSN